MGSSTQYHFKSIYFKSVRTGIRPTNMVQITVQGCVFEGVNVGVDISGDTLGMLNLIDSRASDTKALVKTDQDRSDGVGSLALENVIVDSTVAAVCYSLNCASESTDQMSRRLWLGVSCC